MKTKYPERYLTEDRTLKFLDRKLWLRLGAMLKGHTPLLLVSITCIILMQLLPQYYPKILKDIVDGPIANSNLDGINKYILTFITLIAIVGILQYIAGICGQYVALNIIHKLRTDLFARLQKYHLDFFKRTPVGRLMTRLTNDVDSLNAMFAEGFIELLGAVLMLILPLFFIFALNWKMALASLLVTPLMFITTSLFRIKIREINIKIRASIAELNTRMQENLSGNYIVQMFGKTSEIFSEFKKVNHTLQLQWEKNVKYYSLYFPAINSFTDISLMLMYFTGAWLFIRDSTSLGTIMAFTWYMGMFWRPLREISDKYTMLQSALAAAERVFTLFDVKAQLKQGEATHVTEPVEIKFEKVNFAYDPDVPVLKNITTIFKQGETVAIVGATGGGKSTLMALCNYFYAPDDGRLTVNGTELQEFSPGILQQHISYIPQDVYLFAETIAFNIALTDDVDLSRLEEICKYVNAHDFIAALPQGYRTLLKERGENLSTGQRQLLALARALYHNPKILLLDEATSSIDTKSEELIQKAMAKLTRNFTCIIVAHRLSTIRNADKILVMHQGEITEEGTHYELLNKKGIYQKLYKLQNVAFNL